MNKLILIPFLLLLNLVSSCDFPRDPEHSLDHIKNGTLVVGYSEDPPFIYEENGEVKGEATNLIKAFAKSEDSTIEWEKGPQEDLLKKLSEYKIHVLLNDISKDTPWKKKIGLTKKFKLGSREFMLALPPGENAFLIELENFLTKRLGEKK